MKWINIIALVGVLAINALANTAKINGYATGEISQLYPNLFVPAGFTFSVWSVIYIGLIAFTYYSFKHSSLLKAKHTSPLFIFSCLCNCGWLLAWHYQLLLLSVFIMITLLLTLIAIYLRLREEPALNKTQKWLMYQPISIYLGWICVATIANITAWIVSLKINLPYQDIWSITLIIGTQILVYLMSKKFRDLAFSGVIIWAIIGIYAKIMPQNNYINIQITCAAAIIFSTFISIKSYYSKSIT